MPNFSLHNKRYTPNAFYCIFVQLASLTWSACQKFERILTQKWVCVSRIYIKEFLIKPPLMHSVYWWRAAEFEAESARHARGKKDSRVLPQTLIASVVQARNYCQLQLLPLTRFECFRTAANSRLNQLGIAVTTSMTKEN